MRAPWSAVRNSSNPLAGMRGDDDFFTRGQMCLSLLQTACPPAPPAPPHSGAQPQRTAGLAPALPHTSLIPQTAGESPQTLAPVRAPSARLAAAPVVLCLAPARTRRSARSSNYAPSAGAMCPRLAPEVRPSPAEPFTPPLLATPFRAPLGAPLPPPPPALQPRSTPPAAALSRQTAGEE